MGRMSLLMVMGFNMIFAAMGFDISRVSSTAYENYIWYYENTTRHNVAASAANIAASAFHVSSGNLTGSTFSNVTFFNGKISASITNISYKNRKRLVAVGEYMGDRDSIIVVLQPSSFSKFGFYTMSENGVYWITGDTCFGPFHTQGTLNISGTSPGPVFKAKATSKNGIYKNPTNSTAQFQGGYQSGVNVNLPTDMNALLTGVNNAPGGKFVTGKDITLRFKANGTVDYQEGTGTVTNILLSTLAPNGVIYVDKGNLTIKGKVSGKYTVAAITNGASGKGNVYIDSSVVYAGGNTITNTTDLLGITADQSIIIKDNSNNASPGINLAGSYYARAGSFTAENYSSGSPRGRINLFGGIQQNLRGPVGTFSGGSIVSGYSKSYRYDTRLQTESPPAFPTTGTFEVLSWYE
jgi:hypothetical protein